MRREPPGGKAFHAHAAGIEGFHFIKERPASGVGGSDLKPQVFSVSDHSGEVYGPSFRRANSLKRSYLVDFVLQAYFLNFS